MPGEKEGAVCALARGDVKVSVGEVWRVLMWLKVERWVTQKRNIVEGRGKVTSLSKASGGCNAICKR